MFLILVSILCTICNVLSVHPAISLHQCNIDDDTCITNATKRIYATVLEPNEKISAEQMDPMYQEELDGSIPELKFKLFNTTITGFRSCEVQNAKFIDKNQDRIHIDFICQKFTMDGLYKANGSLLTLSIEGDGVFKLITEKYSFGVDLEGETVNKNGESYRTIKNFKFNAEPLGKIVANLSNLFNGQKDLADAFHKFINEHYKEAALKVQGNVFRAYINTIVQNANKYLKTITTDQN